MAPGRTLPGRSATSEIHSASTSAVKAVAAIACCSVDAVSPISRCGATDSATNSSPARAPATVVLPTKKLVYDATL